MVACSWILFIIISTTTATPQISEYLNQKHKDMNITLRTVDDVDEKEKSEADATSDNVQKLVNEVKSKFNRGNQDGRIAASNIYKDTVTFSDFIQEVIEVLNKFEDEDLENVFSIANAEIKQYHYRGCKIHELTENLEYRKQIAKTLEENRRKTASDIRNHLQAVSEGLKDENSNQYIKMMIDSINSLYKDESINKFNKFLTNLDHYRLKVRRNMDLVKVIRAGIRSVIFDYYSNLDHQVRSQFQSKVNDFWSNYVLKSLPFVKRFANSLTNDVNKKKSNKPTVDAKTTKIIKKKSSKSPSHNYKKTSKHNVVAYDRAIQIEDINDSKPSAEKSLKIETEQQGLQIPWEDFEETYDAIYQPNPPQAHRSIMEVITMRPYVSKRAMTSQKFKYEILFKHDIREPNLHLKKPEFQLKHRIHIRKPNEPMEVIPPLFSGSSVIYLNEQEEKTREYKKVTKRINRLRSTTRKHKRVPRADPAVFNDKYLVQRRMNFDNTSVIKQLQNLEEALRVAQIQIKNDSKIIKDLNSLLANQKVDNNFKYTETPTTEENKNVVIDLKINFDDLKNIVSTPFNEIKQDEIKTALLKKLNIENHDITDSNIDKSNIARKFDFDQRSYNSSTLRGKEMESSLSKRKNNFEMKGYASAGRGYLTDGDTYERTEDRIYDSDTNKGKVHYSEKVNKQNNYEEVTVSLERKTTIDADRQIKNKNEKDNYQNINPYMTSQHKVDPYTDEKRQHAVSSDDEPDEIKKHDDGVKRKNESGSYELEKKLNDKRYTTRHYKYSNEYKKQNENDNSSDKETNNIKGIEKAINYGVNSNDKKVKHENNNPTDYYSESHNNKNNVEINNNNNEANINQNLALDFKLNEKFVVSFQSNEPVKTTGILIPTVATTPQRDELEFKIENENEKFVRTKGLSRGHPKRFSMASPKTIDGASTTDIVTIYPIKILKFATRIP